MSNYLLLNQLCSDDPTHPPQHLCRLDLIMNKPKIVYTFAAASVYKTQLPTSCNYVLFVAFLNEMTCKAFTCSRKMKGEIVGIYTVSYHSWHCEILDRIQGISKQTMNIFQWQDLNSVTVQVDALIIYGHWLNVTWWHLHDWSLNIPKWIWPCSTSLCATLVCSDHYIKVEYHCRIRFRVPYYHIGSLLWWIGTYTNGQQESLCHTERHRQSISFRMNKRDSHQSSYYS